MSVSTTVANFTLLYLYIYIYRERERDRDRETELLCPLKQYNFWKRINDHKGVSVYLRRILFKQAFILKKWTIIVFPERMPVLAFATLLFLQLFTAFTFHWSHFYNFKLIVVWIILTVTDVNKLISCRRICNFQTLFHITLQRKSRILIWLNVCVCVCICVFVSLKDTWRFFEGNLHKNVWCVRCRMF